MPVERSFVAALVMLAACFTAPLVGRQLQRTTNAIIPQSAGAAVPNTRLVVARQPGSAAPLPSVQADSPTAP